MSLLESVKGTKIETKVENIDFTALIEGSNGNYEEEISNDMVGIIGISLFIIMLLIFYILKKVKRSSNKKSTNVNKIKKERKTMKLLKVLVIPIIVYFMVIIPLTEFTNMKNSDIELIALILAIAVLIVYVLKAKVLRDSISVTSDVIMKVNDIKEEIELNINSKESPFYAIAEREHDEGNIDKGLWAQALVKAKGKEDARKFEYMKLRVNQLKKEL